MDIKEPTIIIQFRTQDTLEMLPDIYIRSFEDAIKANAHNNDKLEELKRRVIGIRAEIDNLQAKIWADNNGYMPKRPE